MKLYTIADLNQGAGIFDHTMRSANEYPSDHTDMPGAVAIGVVAAAMNSGLKSNEITDVIDGYFDAKTARLLSNVRQMYGGTDVRIHLWTENEKMTHAWGRGLSYCYPVWRKTRPEMMVPVTSRTVEVY